MASTASTVESFKQGLAEELTAVRKSDPELAALIEQEKQRQCRGIELIASENFVSKSVLECLGSCLTNKYSEGQPFQRYYGGTEVIDAIEVLCKRRCLEAFKLDPNRWAVNVQPYSGSPANLAALVAFLDPHDRFMGLRLSSGGHLTHGYYTAKKRVSASSMYYNSLAYDVHPQTGLIDFEALKRDALNFRPKLIICGASAYPRFIDFQRFRDVADSVGALLMADIAHIAGLVAAGLHPSPFECCDIVTTTTHKTLRGPRSGLIFVNKERLGVNAEDKVDQAVFPALQGGPHNHQIAAVAHQMKQVASPEWVAYAQQILDNAKALANRLIERGQTLVTGGSDNHLVLWDVRPLGLTGSKLVKVTDAVGITLNKNAIPGDVSVLNPGGVRLGTAAMTTRGCGVEDMYQIADLLVECAMLAIAVQETTGKTLSAFTEGLKGLPQLEDLAVRVERFAAHHQLKD